MTKNELNQLNEILKGLNKAQSHTQYLLLECTHEFPDRSSLKGLQNDLQDQIDKLKTLCQSDT